MYPGHCLGRAGQQALLVLYVAYAQPTLKNLSFLVWNCFLKSNPRVQNCFINKIFIYSARLMKENKSLSLKFQVSKLQKSESTFDPFPFLRIRTTLKNRTENTFLEPPVREAFIKKKLCLKSILSYSESFETHFFFGWKLSGYPHT